ncbi:MULTISPECIES: hypothetical protein [Vibrio]|uniref:hypothetical protein n=1 Tax=Vibrio TaxID=662 RepID=UPI002160C974|nr:MULTISPECIES: hypothetical protein [Vibrio]MCS0126583.1 hypothetical protein [Vibrio alginolyticus]MDW3153976.1 hypothetical protein [Vibrio sp. 779(2023)]
MLNEQDAELTCTVLNVTKDTVQVVAVVESKFMAHTRQLMKLAKQQQPNTV